MDELIKYTEKERVVVIHDKKHYKKIGIEIYRLEYISAIFVEDELIIYVYNDYIEVIGTL